MSINGSERAESGDDFFVDERGVKFVIPHILTTEEFAAHQPEEHETVRAYERRVAALLGVKKLSVPESLQGGFTSPDWHSLDVVASRKKWGPKPAAVPVSDADVRPGNLRPPEALVGEKGLKALLDTPVAKRLLSNAAVCNALLDDTPFPMELDGCDIRRLKNLARRRKRVGADVFRAAVLAVLPETD